MPEKEGIMKRTRLQSGILYAFTAALACALVALPRAAQAYGLTGVGGMVGYSTPQDLNGTASVSVHAELENPGTRLHLLPNMMYWNVDRVSDVAPNLDAYYHFKPDSKVTPYVGGGLGLNFIHDDRFGVDRSNTDLGMNLAAGVRFPQSANHYFIEGRYTASDISQVSLRTGMTFHTP